MRSLIQATPAYELSVDIATTPQWHSLRLISFVPTARRPEDHVKFQGVFSTAEITALRDQLASTSTQLAQVRAVGPQSPPAAPAAPPGTMTPTAMQSAMTTLALTGVEKRTDGGVVRIEIPADTLFESGGANLMPAGTALLTQISDEVERVYPGHFLGIEGHTDTEPLKNASWGSQHQLSVARASAVFDFLTSRTSLKQGQLFLVAHGPNHPVVSNATAAGRARNRRIELVINPERSGADGPAAAHPAAAATGGG